MTLDHQISAPARATRPFRRAPLARIAGLFAGLLAVGAVLPAWASDAVTYVRRGASYQDVRLELEAAIIAEGLKIDLVGDIAGMLKRTGPDVGSTVPVYKNAEFFAFCSAKLSREMMERDAANMAQCPYVVFLYQREATINEVSVGYRKVTVQGRAQKSLEQINAMLDRIVKKATK